MPGGKCVFDISYAVSRTPVAFPTQYGTPVRPSGVVPPNATGPPVIPPVAGPAVITGLSRWNGLTGFRSGAAGACP